MTLTQINERLDLYLEYQEYKMHNYIWFLPRMMMLEFMRSGNFYHYESSCSYTFDQWLVQNGKGELVG